MKRFIISVLVALSMSATCYSKVVREGNNFKVETNERQKDEKTQFTWEDKDGNVYPIYMSKKGALYVVKISKKSGKEYRYYLPKDAQLVIKKELKIQ